MKKCVLFIFIFYSSFVFAKDSLAYGETKISRIAFVCDGNTFKVDIDDYPPIIGKNISVRISNVYTPQLNSKDERLKLKAQQAKSFTKNFLETGKIIILKNIKRDIYFRLLADVIVDDKNLGSELLKNKLALPYDQNKKPQWIFVN